MIPLALFMLGWLSPDTPVGPAPRSGLYAEQAPDGADACHDTTANRFRLHLAPDGRPPHARSANIGHIDLRVDGRSGTFILTPGGDRWHYGGGRQHTVGVEIDGVTNAFLTGRLDLALTDAGPDRLGLGEARYSPIRRGPGSAARVFAQDGTTPDGRRLRPFNRCGD